MFGFGKCCLLHHQSDRTFCQRTWLPFSIIKQCYTIKRKNTIQEMLENQNATRLQLRQGSGLKPHLSQEVLHGLYNDMMFPRPAICNPYASISVVIALTQKEIQKPLGKSCILNYEFLSEISCMEKHSFCDGHKQTGIFFILCNTEEGVYSVKIFGGVLFSYPQKIWSKNYFYTLIQILKKIGRRC